MTGEEIPERTDAGAGRPPEAGPWTGPRDGPEPPLEATLRLPRIPFVRHGMVELLDFKFDLETLGTVVQHMAEDLHAAAPNVLDRCRALLRRVDRQLEGVQEGRREALDGLLESLDALVDDPDALRAVREEYALGYRLRWSAYAGVIPRLDGVAITLDGDLFIGERRYRMHATAWVPELTLTSATVRIPDGTEHSLLA